MEPIQESPARQDFVRWLAQPNHTQLMVAEVCGVAQSLVSGWKHGRGRPSEVLRPAIFVLTGIKPLRWRTKEERAMRAAALRRAAAAVKQQKAPTSRRPR